MSRTHAVQIKRGYMLSWTHTSIGLVLISGFSLACGGGQACTQDKNPTSEVDTSSGSAGKVTPEPAGERAESGTAETQPSCAEVDPLCAAFKKPRTSHYAPPYLVVQGVAESLPYLEVIVGDAHLNDKLPMVIAIHGLGYRARFPEDPFPEVGLAMRVILPSGPDTFRSGFSWLSVQVRDNKPKALAAELKKRAALLHRFTQAVTKRHKTQGKPVVLGFSQGGMLTWTLATQYPETYSTAFPIAAYLPPSLVPKTRLTGKTYPIIKSMHAKDDQVIPIPPTRDMVAKIQKAGIDVEFQEFERAGHDMSKDMKKVFHTWVKEAVERAIR